VGGEEVFGDGEFVMFEGLGVGDPAAEEVSGGAGGVGEEGGEEAAGAGFGGGEGVVALEEEGGEGGFEGDVVFGEDEGAEAVVELLAEDSVAARAWERGPVA